MEPLKNMYSAEFISDLSQHLSDVCPNFKYDFFESKIFDDQWEDRELKERMRHVTECLRMVLPEEYKEAVRILMTISDRVKSGDIQFPYITFPDFIEQYGQHDWETSIEALEVVTKSSSSEFAIRPFLISDRDRP